MNFSNFTMVYLFWYMLESDKANSDDMGCMWNAGPVRDWHDFFNVALQIVEVWKARKMVMKSEIV